MKTRMLFVLSLLPGGALLAQAKPNVIFIMTDQQSADTLSCQMGDRYIKTPALDQLAARGTNFTRAYSPNPLCMPARNSIYTGRYPHEIDVTDNTAPKIIDAAKFATMGTYFRRAGYETAFFGKWHLAYDEAKLETHGFENLKIGHNDDVTTGHAVKFLSQPHDRPFLLVVNLVNPHNVCELSRDQALDNGPIGSPPPVAQRPPPPANLAPPRNEPDSMARIRAGYHANRQFPVANFSPERWQTLRWGYYRLIEKVDAEIGRVLTALRTAGVADNTLVVFTSDHGECAGAHGFNQKTVFYEESARVPLIVSAPGQQVARTSAKLVNIGLDLLPTLLDFAGVARPAQLPGLSLRALTAGEAVKSWRDFVVVENNLTQAGFVDGTVPATQGRMVRAGFFKYCIYEHGQRRESLVDLEKDPGETTDLATDPAHRKVLLEFRERLRRWAVAHNDPLVAAMLADDVKPVPFPVVKPNKQKANEWAQP